MPFLVVEEFGQRRRVPFRGKCVTIGRAPDNDVVLAEEKSSRRHALVEYDGSAYLVRDLDSLNGCYVDGLRIREQPLNFGDVFTIGQARIMLEMEESTAFGTAINKPLPPVTKAETPPPPVFEPAPASIRLKDTRPVTIVAASLAQALTVFDAVAVKPGIDTLLRATCAFSARVMPGIRVCIATLENTEVRPLAFANFITARVEDELPPDFSIKSKAVLQSRRAIWEDTPARAWIPLAVDGGAQTVFYMEHESPKMEFDDETRAMAAALAAPVTALLALRGALGERDKLKETVRKLETDLATVRKELQLRLDMQTAELSRLREPSLRPGGPEFRHDYSHIVGKSAAMKEVFKLMDKVTDLPVPVLIIGESGTGKDVLARTIHEHSARALTGTFVAENCAALPETLLESELFGHVKGAFTGADKDKIGLFETADKGTIFLDEIGETTSALQAKLLRVLEDGDFRPVGGNKPKRADFRLIAATNRPLEDMMKKGGFRQDLFYRINVITIRIPPLRERREDIPLLVEHFLKAVAAETGGEPKRAAGGVLRAMMEHSWPGNVRELENEIKRVAALAEGDKITMDELSPALRGKGAGGPAFNPDEDIPLKDLIELVEKRRIEEVVARHGGNKSKAADALGLSRLGLRKKMERFGLE